MSAPPAKAYLTFAEYLVLEDKAPYWHEYLDGEMFPRAQSTFTHACISTNIGAELSRALRRSIWMTFNCNLRIGDPGSDFAAYPDASVACEPLEYVRESQTTLANPTAIVEVFSDATEAYDRGTKFYRYRQLESLQVYALVSERTPLVDVYTLESNETWKLTPVQGLEGIAAFPTLGVSIPLAEIYAGVNFEPAPRPVIPRE
jgi:Uma2 family endonuclease